MISQRKVVAHGAHYREITTSRVEQLPFPEKKVKLVLVVATLLSLLSFILCVIAFSSNSYVVTVASLIIGLMAYIISMKCLHFLNEQKPKSRVKAIILIIIVGSCLVLSFAIACAFIKFFGL